MGLAKFGHHEGEDWGGGVSWWCSSKSDPRWNGNGATTSLFSVDDEVTKHVDRLRPTLGEPPADLECGGVKD